MAAKVKAKALLLSCIDVRFLDEIVDFMNRNGYTDDYDHVILAGAALGALGGPDPTAPQAGWRVTFFQHLEAAINLHGITEVIILEHRDCGAYSHKVFDTLEAQGPDEASAEFAEREFNCHVGFAKQLTAAIHSWYDVKYRKTDRPKQLHIRAFLMWQHAAAPHQHSATDYTIEVLDGGPMPEVPPPATT